MTPEQREELKKLAQEILNTRGVDMTLSQYLGARQEFERKAHPEVILALIDQIDSLKKRAARAERALIRGGFVDHGAQEWKPPLGKPPRFIEVEVLTVPQGWKLVPAEPTRDMVLAGAKHTTSPEDDETTEQEAYFVGLGRAACAYVEMLSAAPTIPAIPGTKEAS
jgi:hypothetical protein